MMKTQKLFLLILILLSVRSFSQPRITQKKEQLKALKVSFITNELALTPEEAAKFWPIYNAFDEKQFELKQNKLKDFRRRMELRDDKISEKEATIILNQMENNEDEFYQIRKKFISSLRGVLPSLKIIKLKKAEEDFNRKLLEEYRKKPFRP